MTPTEEQIIKTTLTTLVEMVFENNIETRRLQENLTVEEENLINGNKTAVLEMIERNLFQAPPPPPAPLVDPRLNE